MKILCYDKDGKVIFGDMIDEKQSCGMCSIGYSYHPLSNPTHCIILNFQQYFRFEIVEDKHYKE